MLNWRNIILSSMLAGTLIAPTVTYGMVNLNNNFVESYRIFNEPNSEQEKCPNHKKDHDCKKDHEKFQKRMEERNKIIDEADKIVPGIKAQWQEVVKERKELLIQMKENKSSEGKKLEKHSGEKNKNRKNIKEANKKKWDELNEAVKAKDAQKVKSSFDSILKTMKERNEKLSEKIKHMKE